MRSRLYLSGPMTGLPEFNYPAFHEAKAALVAEGYDVLSPADLPPRADWSWVDFMEVDIDMVFAADGVACLPGCEASQGARIEHRVAVGRGIPVLSVGAWLAAQPVPA